MNQCPVCILSVMHDHPELLYWVKCPICGYSQFNSEINEEKIRDKMASRYLYKAIERLEAPPDEDE